MKAKRIMVGMLACLGLAAGLGAACPPEDGEWRAVKIAPKESACCNGEGKKIILHLGDETIDFGQHLHALMGKLHDDIDMDDLHEHLMHLKGDLDLDGLHEHLMHLKGDLDMDSLHDHLMHLKGDLDVDALRNHLIELKGDLDLDAIHQHLKHLDHADLHPIVASLQGLMQPEPSKSKSRTRVVTKGDGKESGNFVVVEDDNTFTLTLEDGKVKSVERNGKKVDPANIRKNGDRVEIVDDGKAVFTFDLSDSGDVWVAQGAQGMPMPGYGSVMVQAEPPKAMIGVQLGEPDGLLLGHFGLEAGEATLVTGVYDGFPADEAGLKPYDIIVGVDGKKPASQGEVREALRGKGEGDRVELTIIHRGERKDIKIKLVKYDQEALEKAELDAIEFNAMAFTTGQGGAGGGDNVFVVPGLGSFRGLQGQDPEKWREFAEQWKKQAEDYAEKFKNDPNFKGFRMEVVPQPPSTPMPGQGGGGDMQRLEDRLERLEKMIERLAERQAERNRGGGGGR